MNYLQQWNAYLMDPESIKVDQCSLDKTIVLISGPDALYPTARAAREQPLAHFFCPAG